MSRFVLPVIAALLVACSGSTGEGATDPASTLPPTAAPSSQAPETPSQPTTAAPQATASPDASAIPASASPVATAEPVADLPLWQTAELRDVRTGTTFRIADFSDKVVVVEPMATWCPSCRSQQNAAREALAQLSSDQIVFVSLDVDPNETEADLATYADGNEYPWMFAVAPVDVARSLAQSFGDQVLSPPSTPKIVVAPGAEPSVSFGFTSTADLTAQLGALAQ